MYVDHVDGGDVLKTFAISVSTRARSKFDHLILRNVIVHRRDTMSYWLTHMKHEKIIPANDREIANVAGKSRMHVEDNSMRMNEHWARLNDHDNDDENSKNNHNDSNRYY